MKAVVYGVGATGSRAARQLLSMDILDDLVLIDADSSVAEEAVSSLGSPARTASVSSLRTEARINKFLDLVEDADVVILATADDHVDFAEAALRAGTHVVSVDDDLDTVQELLRLKELAKEFNRTLVVGAGFSPGLSCVLALHASRKLDRLDEVHTAKFGTGGPECARQHHRSLREDSLSWRDGEWVTAGGGTARELYWFPDPIGGTDCYQASLPDPVLMHNAFPDAKRTLARVAATRRDMSTRFLPMMRKPHPEGLLGAIRVELRGMKDGTFSNIILGAIDRPAVAAGTVAAVAARWANEGKFESNAAGLGELVKDSSAFLADLSERGVKAAVFEGNAGR